MTRDGTCFQGRTAIVIPAYNEGERAAAVVNELVQDGYDVVCINDGSSDRTAYYLEQTGAVILHHGQNLGQGAALATGFRFLEDAKYDFVVTFDSDGQHDAEDILRAVQKLDESEADILLGSRFLGTIENIPASRRILLKAALLFTRLTSGLKLTDTHNGFRVIRRDKLRYFRLKQNRMAHASEFHDIIKAHGLDYIEYPNRIRYTEYSLGKGQRMSGAFTILSDLLLGRMYK